MQHGTPIREFWVERDCTVRSLDELYVTQAVRLFRITLPAAPSAGDRFMLRLIHPTFPVIIDAAGLGIEDAEVALLEDDAEHDLEDGTVHDLDGNDTWVTQSGGDGHLLMVFEGANSFVLEQDEFEEWQTEQGIDVEEEGTVGKWIVTGAPGVGYHLLEDRADALLEDGEQHELE